MLRGTCTWVKCSAVALLKSVIIVFLNVCFLSDTPREHERGASVHSGSASPPLVRGSGRQGLCCLVTQAPSGLPLPLPTLQPLPPSTQGSCQLIFHHPSPPLQRAGSGRVPPHSPGSLRTRHGSSCLYSGPAAPKLFPWALGGTSLPLTPQSRSLGAAEPRERRLTFPPQKTDKHLHARIQVPCEKDSVLFISEIWDLEECLAPTRGSSNIS